MMILRTAGRRSPASASSRSRTRDASSGPVASPPPQGLLPRIRHAEAYEALRDRTDAAGTRPKIFLATLGPVSAHSARAAFAANLFQGAGLACVTGPVDEFADAGTGVACLCSSDKVYADEAGGAVKELRDAGAAQVWLAGQVDVDGVDGTVFAGCDALAALRTTLDALGVDA